MPDTERGTAKIALLAAVVGALVGGATAYLGNAALYESEQTDMTRGTARVLQIDFAQAANMWSNYWRGDLDSFPSEFAVEIAPSDVAALATEMDRKAWGRVAAARREIAFTDSRMSSDRQLPCDWRSRSAFVAKRLAEGAVALNDAADFVAGGDVPTRNIVQSAGKTTPCADE